MANDGTGLDAAGSDDPQADADGAGGKSAAPRARQVFWMHPEDPAPSAGARQGASAQAIVSEIEACARRFAETGETASIDLRCLKSMPEEREILAGALGHGEVSAVVAAIGRSEIHETSIPCVWWVSHRNSEEEIVGELIEIAEIPDLLMGDRQSVAYGLAALRSAWPFRMQEGAPIATT